MADVLVDPKLENLGLITSRWHGGERERIRTDQDKEKKVATLAAVQLLVTVFEM